MHHSPATYMYYTLKPAIEFKIEGNIKDGYPNKTVMEMKP